MFFVQRKRHFVFIIFMCLGYSFCVFLMKSTSLVDVKRNITELQPLKMMETFIYNDSTTIGNLSGATISGQNSPVTAIAMALNPFNPTAALNQNQFSTTISDGVTCSTNASASGSHQKLITYTIYGNDIVYWRGLPEIMIQAKILYPSWHIRVYTDNPNYEVLKILSQKFNFLQICDVNNLPSPKISLKEYPSMMWRYYPLGDPQVDFIIFRDSDSELLVREQDAVEEWLDRTSKSLHIMRDHPYHGSEILGGMWGARITSNNREKWVKTRDTLFDQSHGSNRKKYLDQTLLNEVVWPAFNSDFMAHDSYLCKSYPGSVPFPSQRTKDAFVGSQYYAYYGYGKLYECPVECRPLNHKDWIYC